jgi:hypothetical protein
MPAKHRANGQTGQGRITLVQVKLWIFAMMTADLSLMVRAVGAYVGSLVDFNKKSPSYGHARPSIDRMTVDLAVSRSSIKRAVAQLEADGWFRVRKGLGRKHASEYLLNVERARQQVRLAAAKRAHNYEPISEEKRVHEHEPISAEKKGSSGAQKGFRRAQKRVHSSEPPTTYVEDSNATRVANLATGRDARCAAPRASAAPISASSNGQNQTGDRARARGIGLDQALDGALTGGGSLEVAPPGAGLADEGTTNHQQGHPTPPTPRPSNGFDDDPEELTARLAELRELAARGILDSKAYTKLATRERRLSWLSSEIGDREAVVEAFASKLPEYVVEQKCEAARKVEPANRPAYLRKCIENAVAERRDKARRAVAKSKAKYQR